MRRRVLSTAACLVAALVAASSAPRLGHATVFRDATADHMPEAMQALLGELHDRLNAGGQDVVDAALKEFDGPPSDKPRLTALRALPLSSVAPDNNFLDELRAGDALLAVKSNVPQDYDVAGVIPFYAEWIKADPNGRVFVSYARDDHALASKIKAELEAMGYSVFLYRADDHTLMCPGGPCIGRFLSTAQLRIAINSRASARSAYVQAEAFWTRGGREAREGDCIWRLVRESYPNAPDTFIYAQVQRVVAVNAGIYPSLAY